jgi:hypothetical protein
MKQSARRYTLTLALTALVAGSVGHAQDRPAEDRLGPLRGLLGSWEGTSEGQPGSGTVRRSYELALRERFIEVRNSSIYPPQPKNAKGEIHEDRGFFSYDAARKRLVFRQFHVEGFVVEYEQDEAAAPNRIAFTSVGIENIPPGWTARETYVIHGPDEFEEIFELGEPGKALEVYSRSRLKRVR